ncbi:hypothetical protein GDO86_016112 [Hymenochirus boettgeri]|uniref:G-protein coupled receptors family 1 profile domain-containing protein n=1 Tax=Hymenochirus boettgeri TaxID=247094 RepID=A0A8T2K1Q9_9PIPI|nr:hypothetical protein GDO86_016112 [Hymenochirus boettgeri]
MNISHNQTMNITGICQPAYNESMYFVSSMYGIVLVIGLPANMLTLWLTFLQIRRENVLAVYLFSLSFSELMYLGTLPLWILYVNNGHNWNWGPIACKITGFIFFNNIYISILLLCCISLDRFLAVQYCLECRGIRRQRIAMIVTFLLCLTVALIHSTVFILKDGEQKDGEQNTCFETLPIPPMIAHFYIARFIIGFLLPFLILIFTNCSIQKRIEISESFTPKQKLKVKHLSLAVITIFMICFAPYHLVLLIRAIVYYLNPKKSCAFEENIYTANSVLLCLVTVNSVADPFIYVIVSENVRKDICRGLRAWRRQLSVKSDNSTFPNIYSSREHPKENSSAHFP